MELNYDRFHSIQKERKYIQQFILNFSINLHAIIFIIVFFFNYSTYEISNKSGINETQVNFPV